EADPRERIRLARKALASLPLKPRGRVAVRALLAHAMVDAGQLEAARREWLTIATEGPGEARARIEAGLLAEQLGRLDVAERDYHSAVRRGTPDQRAEATAVLARFHVRHGAPDKAL